MGGVDTGEVLEDCSLGRVEAVGRARTHTKGGSDVQNKAKTKQSRRPYHESRRVLSKTKSTVPACESQ